MSSDKPLKLHLGCGEISIPGFVNIDIRYMPGVDKVDNIQYLRSYKPDSVDLIYACAVLEHLGRWNYKGALKRWCEIIKPGGVLRISVPGWEELVEHYNEHKDLRVLEGMLYGGQDYEQNNHFYVWDWKIMNEDLKEAGFSEIRRYDWRKTEHSDIDDFSQSYLPHMQKDESRGGKLMHLNVEAVK